MFEILLFGLALVVIYLIAHLAVTRLELWLGKPLGVWRTLAFFGVFFVLLLGAFELIPWLLGDGGGGQS